MSKKGRRTYRAAVVETPAGATVFASHDCHVLDNLASARAHQHELEESIRQLVHHARDEHGIPWEDIAERLGVTRQAVAKRYGGDRVRDVDAGR